MISSSSSSSFPSHLISLYSSPTSLSNVSHSLDSFTSDIVYPASQQQSENFHFETSDVNYMISSSSSTSNRNQTTRICQQPINQQVINEQCEKEVISRRGKRIEGKVKQRKRRGDRLVLYYSSLSSMDGNDEVFRPASRYSPSTTISPTDELFSANPMVLEDSNSQNRTSELEKASMTTTSSILSQSNASLARSLSSHSSESIAMKQKKSQQQPQQLRNQKQNLSLSSLFPLETIQQRESRLIEKHNLPLLKWPTQDLLITNPLSAHGTKLLQNQQYQIHEQPYCFKSDVSPTIQLPSQSTTQEQSLNSLSNLSFSNSTSTMSIIESIDMNFSPVHPHNTEDHSKKRKPVVRISLSPISSNPFIGYLKRSLGFSGLDSSRQLRRQSISEEISSVSFPNDNHDSDYENHIQKALCKEKQHDSTHVNSSSPGLLFFLVKQPQDRQWRSYPNADRFLLPNPLVISMNKSISHKLQYATANVELVTENGEYIMDELMHNRLEGRELLDGEWMQVLDANGTARFSLKCLISSSQLRFRLLFNIRYQFLGELKASTIAVLSTPFIVMSNESLSSFPN